LEMSLERSTMGEAALLDLVNRGEESLIGQVARSSHELAQVRMYRGRIEVGVQELSHLHAQLNSMTTQCTLLIGFALAGLGADTLSQLASDESQFCMFKSDRAMTLGYFFMLSTTACIFFSMLVIACAQTITASSNKRIFDFDDTRSVVLMTSFLMHGDNRIARHRVKQGDPSLARFVAMTNFFNCAMFTFFCETVFAIWIFFGTNNWIKLSRDGANLYVPDGNGTMVNPKIIETDEGQYRVHCSDPYNQESSDRFDSRGTVLAFLLTVFLLVCSAVFMLTRVYVLRMFTEQKLNSINFIFSEKAVPSIAGTGVSPV